MKQSNFRLNRILCCTVLLVVMNQAIYARPEVKCVWVKNPVTVDGQNKEWIGSLTLFEKEDIALGVKRDEDFLYLGVLFSGETILQQVLTQGLIVWLDPEGGKEKKLGVKFPLTTMEIESFPDSRNHTPGDSPQMKPANEEGMSQPSHFIFLVAEEDDETMLEYLQPEAMEVQAAQLAHTLFYELKIPLNRDKDHPVGIGIRSNKKLSIGLEAPRIDEHRREEYYSQAEGVGNETTGGLNSGTSGGLNGGTSGNLNSGMGGGITSGIPGSLSTRIRRKRYSVPASTIRNLGRPVSPKSLNVWIKVEDIEKSGH